MVEKICIRRILHRFLSLSMGTTTNTIMKSLNKKELSSLYLIDPRVKKLADKSMLISDTSIICISIVNK